MSEARTAPLLTRSGDVHTLHAMASHKKRYTFFITEELDQGLKALKERDGMPEAEALRRGLAAFLIQKGVLAAPAAAGGRGDRTPTSRRRGLPRKP
jgi:hypothetical protein